MFKITHQNWLKKLLFVMLLLPILAIYLYNVASSYQYDSDFGRDISDMLSIAQGDMRLLGPKLSFGGIHTGPYYYYLFAPLLAWTPHQPENIVLANAILSWLGIVTIFFLLIKSWRTKPFLAVLATYWLALLPAVLFSARGPGNAFTHQVWFLVLLLCVPTVMKHLKWWVWLGYGLFFGVILNFHLIGVVVVLPLMCVLAVDQVRRGWQKRLVLSMMLALGVVAAFSPVMVFDLTHGMVQFKNTFIDKSYLAFTQNTNLPSPLPTSSNLLINAKLMHGHLSPWLGLPFTLISLMAIGLGVTHWLRLSRSARTLIVTLPISFLTFVVVARSQMAIHYLFPVALLSATTLVVVLVQSVSIRVSSVTLVAMLSVVVLNWPSSWYRPALRSMAEFRDFTNQLVNSSIKPYMSPNQFAVFVTRETPLAPHGHEYRYFLSAQGLAAVAPDQYAQAEFLIWIAERPEVDYLSTQSWELDQFGAKEEVLVEKIGGREVRVFKKVNKS